MILNQKRFSLTAWSSLKSVVDKEYHTDKPAAFNSLSQQLEFSQSL